MKHLSKKTIAFYVWISVSFVYLCVPMLPGFTLAVVNVLFAMAAVLLIEEP